MGKRDTDHRAIALREIKLERREKVAIYFAVSFFMLSLLALGLLFGIENLRPTGYSTSINASAGSITEVVVSSKIAVDVWGGLYGLVLRVPDFTQQLDEELDSGNVERADVFFDCLQTDATGGAEFYASTNGNLSLASATITPASISAIDTFINCSGELYCADQTFTRTIDVFLGGTNISGVPATYTYKWNGENEIFDVGALNISGSLAFVSHVNTSIHQGFNPDVLVNYQMMVPTPANTTQTYYFYSDPNDNCPSGGIGTSINATVTGYVVNSGNSPVENASVSIAGFSTLTNGSGYYNLSTLVLEGSYNFIVQASGYSPFISNVSINFSDYVLEKNATLQTEATSQDGTTIIPFVSGFVNGSGNVMLEGVNVSLGNASVVTNGSGYYNFSPLVVIGEQPIVAIKENYDNYYKILDIGLSNTTIRHNISMDAANLNIYPTGPFTEDNVDDEEGDETEKAKEEAEKQGQDFWISTSEINKQVRENTFIEDSISIYNFKSSGNLQAGFSVSSEISDILKLDASALSVGPGSFEKVVLTISGTKPIGIYRGTLTISGDLASEVPVKIEIVPRKLPISTLEMDLGLFEEFVNTGDELRYRVNMRNLLSDQEYRISLKHLVLNRNGTVVFAEENEDVEIDNTLSILRGIDTGNLTEGEYLLSVEGEYLGQFSSASVPFDIRKPVYLYSFFGIPLWVLFVAASFLGFMGLNFILYKTHMNRKKRYHLALDPRTLPQPGERSIKLGRIAEKKIPAYYNIDDLTTHAIVAGATGGGKSISAQVFVEEMLQKNIAVIVFDPTAQWSGMLRKCEDKKMLSFYQKFGLKPGDAKAFPGNVRQIQNERQAVDINKHIHPGQIQIFTLNKLTPQQIDKFVATVIASIFNSDPKENPELKTLLVFDEVHRLLPKFGGSGKGFLQIERACREFRKWGLGVMLVSQVLSDFVGEIKANINTEVQMRVAEENDLARIKERYGPDSLKSLVRADVGTGMVQNAEYNKGKPYFVSFRPILHNTRRLSDEVLEKYNKYNDQIDDIEYQIEQLEELKVDTFDLKMELKLVKDKLMTGNFTVVDIYLEGLGPRLEKQWQSIGKRPKKRQLELVEEGALEESLKEAEKGRKEFDEENKKKGEEEGEKNEGGGGDKEEGEEKTKEEKSEDKEEESKGEEKDEGKQEGN